MIIFWVLKHVLLHIKSNHNVSNPLHHKLRSCSLRLSLIVDLFKNSLINDTATCLCFLIEYAYAVVVNRFYEVLYSFWHIVNLCYCFEHGQKLLLEKQKQLIICSAQKYSVWFSVLCIFKSFLRITKFIVGHCVNNETGNLLFDYLFEKRKNLKIHKYFVTISLLIKSQMCLIKWIR